MTVGWPLTFLRQGQLWVPLHLYGENIEQSFYHNELKTKDWNLQCMIKVVKCFSYYQKFCHLGVLCPCSWAIYMYKIVLFLNAFFCVIVWEIFTRFNMEPSVERVLTISSNGFALLNKMAAMPIYGKSTKTISFPKPRKLWGWILV